MTHSLDPAAYFQTYGLSSEIIQKLIDSKIHPGNFKHLRETDIREIFSIPGDRIDVRVAVDKARGITDSSTLLELQLQGPSAANSLTSMRPDQPKQEGTTRLFVETLAGKKLPFDVDPRCRIEDVMALIEQTDGTPVHEQRLIFAGNRLDRLRTLADYNIKSDAAIFMVIR